MTRKPSLNREDFEQLAAELEQTDAPPKSARLTITEALQERYARLFNAKGWTAAEAHAWLENKKITVSLATVRRAMAADAQQSGAESDTDDAAADAPARSFVQIEDDAL